MQDRTYRFGQFELRLPEGELRANDAIVRLQGKPLLLLIALLDHPQRLVTREQLRNQMWDARTVVDYEQGINVAITKVRDALGDSVENPKYIETVARKGYRLLIAVTVEEARPLDAPTRAGSPDGAALAPSAGPPAGVDRRAPTFRRRWLLPAAAVVSVCVTAGLGLPALRAPPRHASEIHSLAVLPLQDLSPDSGQEYFADGITEELITNLAQILPLRVISRTSVMRYKRTDKPIAQIAQELGVEAIVEGSVTRSGNRISVTVQLIDAAEDRHLWARKYERGIEDMMAAESELSQSIAAQVSGTLNLQHLNLANSRPVDPQVHELCLLGRYHLNKRTPSDMAKSEEYYQQAIAIDPRYAPAYAGLADVYALLPHYSTAALQENFAKARAAARHALELDDTLAEAYATLGFVSISMNPDWKEAEPDFRRALELNPSYATAHHWFAYDLFFLDRRDEALVEIGLARQLDPLSAIVNADEGHFLYAVRRFDEARVRLRRAIELAPDLGEPHETLALIELESGHASEALQEARLGIALAPADRRAMAESGYVFATTGQTAEAEKLLAALKELGRQGGAEPAYILLLELGLGLRDQALDTLNEFSGSRFGSTRALGQWHGFDVLNADPQYRKRLAQLQVGQ